jgi:hypothetical protein
VGRILRKIDAKRGFVAPPSRAAEKVLCCVILSEAKNLSLFLFLLKIEERFLASLGMTEF